MAIKEPSFTLGIEEEYLLVDKDSRDLAQEPPPALLAKCEEALRGQVSPEFLRSQIEVGTSVCKSMAGGARPARSTCAARSAASPMSSGSRRLPPRPTPSPNGASQQHTDKERYNVLAQDLQHVARRLVICGMHVHVGIEDDELRIDLLNQASYFLPHLLGAVDLLAVLAGRADRPQVLPAVGVRRAAPHRRPAPVRRAGASISAPSSCWSAPG